MKVMTVPGLTVFEQAVLDKLLAGDEYILRVLQRQAGQASLGARTMTGVGFYCTLVLPPDVHEVSSPTEFEIADVKGTFSNLQHGAQFVLFVRSGRIAWFEGYTSPELWPTEIQGFTLTYLAEPRRIPTEFPSPQRR